MIRNRMPRWKLEAAQRMRRNPTPGEASLWKWLRNKRLGVRFRRQAPIYGYIADFWCPALRLCVEVDGLSHTGQWKRDNDRDRHLVEWGIMTLRFTEFQAVAKPRWCAQQIMRLFALEVAS